MNTAQWIAAAFSPTLLLAFTSLYLHSHGRWEASFWTTVASMYCFGLTTVAVAAAFALDALPVVL